MHHFSSIRILRDQSMPIHAKPKTTKPFSWTNFNMNVTIKMLALKMKFRYLPHTFLSVLSLESFSVLSRFKSRDDVLQLSSGFTLRKVLHVIVIGCHLDQPVRFDVCDSPDVVLGG